MKQPITFISIERKMDADVEFGFTSNTTVRIYREGTSGHFDGMGNYETNPFNALKKGKISNASVIRAKRAQLALLERKQ